MSLSAYFSDPTITCHMETTSCAHPRNAHFSWPNSFQWVKRSGWISSFSQKYDTLQKLNGLHMQLYCVSTRISHCKFSEACKCFFLCRFICELNRMHSKWHFLKWLSHLLDFLASMKHKRKCLAKCPLFPNHMKENSCGHHSLSQYGKEHSR